MNDKPHPEMGYGSCLGIIRLAGQYSPARMEAAAERALLTGACRYQSVKSILKDSLDTAMLNQPMIEKLLAMRLQGMAESLKTQEQNPVARELSFLERLGIQLRGHY